MNHLSPTIGGTAENYKGIVLPPGIMRETAKPKEEIRPKPAAYLRLSRDDGKYKIVSASIETQRDIVQNYADNAGLHITDFYIDDGWSGTNFDRPDWKRMMDDIASGKINMIISKDMSRIGRDAIAVGLFHREYCLRDGIRLIAVSDGIDTSITGSEEIMQILNMYNGWYPRDISKKTRMAKLTRAENGWFLGSRAPFGYQKSPEDKHVLIPNEDAPVVLEIFQRATSGETVRQICDDFNARGVTTPSMRLYMEDPLHPNIARVSPVWTYPSISNMLNNMVYIGHTVQHKREVVDFTTKQRRTVPADQHIVIKDTHEPIIPVELWNAVQSSRKGRNTPKKTRRSPELNLFAGYVFCADCGSVLAATKKENKSVEYDLLRCARYNNGGKHACSSHSIRFDALYALVLEDIQLYTHLAAKDEQVLTNRLHQLLLAEEQADVKTREKKIAVAQQKIEALCHKIERLYDEKFEHGMEEETFQSMLTRYESEKTVLEQEHSELKAEALQTRNTEKNIHQWMGAVKQAVSVDKLSRGLLATVIDRIVVHEREKTDDGIRQRVDIYYKFVGNISEMEQS